MLPDPRLAGLTSDRSLQASPQKPGAQQAGLPASTQAGVQPACAVGTADRRNLF